MILGHEFKIVLLAWYGAGSNYFNLSIFVDKNIIRMHVSNFFFDSFELVSCSDHVIE